ncbi:leucine-rich repeat-containing G protein-coupled receptor 3 isoform X2 [Neodiprion pinetum]|uniref:leucine-rich repeat-containing G protein-coupled receptor 3 isoform X2 n=1 Tax=Neodiprion pinetum TaxID=441929 RepID=UPI001EE0AD4E|nr:relaxin receptor 1 isoform X2 [Neodiprion pinetum]
MKYKHIAKVGVSLISFLIILSGLMYYFSQDECPRGTFPCANSTVCIAQREWCDKVPNCPYGDDENEDECFDSNGSWDFFYSYAMSSGIELTCESFQPPKKCHRGRTACQVTCVGAGLTRIPENMTSNLTSIVLTNNSLSTIGKNALVSYGRLTTLLMDDDEIAQIEPGAFENQKNLVWLTLLNNKLTELRRGHFTGLESLVMLLVEGNRIEYADLTDFENQTSVGWIGLNRNNICSSCLKLPYMPRLKELYLEMNRIDEISEDLLSGLPGLTGLSLKNNEIRTIRKNAFKNQQNLVELNLAYNAIITLSPHLFLPLEKLRKLILSFNPIENLSIDVLNPLQDLRSLDLQEIEIDNMDKNVFSMLPNLSFVYFKKFHYCTTYAPQVQVCLPRSDGVSSLSDLLGKRLLRAAVWGISCVTCLGNALVLWGRLTARDENRVLSIMIRNLAVSDMLMGFYLLTIAAKDLQYRDVYNVMANDWMSSWGCTIVGALAMISSEVSVLILSFMSVERFVLIASPLKINRPLTARHAYSSMIVIWVVGVIVALIPIIHWRSSTRFYGANGMCFPLHIDNPFLVGWEYSAFVFLGMNFFGLVVIFYVYTGMFASIWRTRHATPLAVGDSEFALRFFLIVLTDAACWVPIIVLKIVAMTKYPVPPDLHAWVVIFILPVNSAVNPLLYTFTTPKFRERLAEGWFGRIRNIVSRRQSDTQISRSSSNKNVILVLSTDHKESIGTQGIRYSTPFNDEGCKKKLDNHSF